MHIDPTLYVVIGPVGHVRTPHDTMTAGEAQEVADRLNEIEDSLSEATLAPNPARPRPPRRPPASGLRAPYKIHEDSTHAGRFHVFGPNGEVRRRAMTADGACSEAARLNALVLASGLERKAIAASAA